MHTFRTSSSLLVKIVLPLLVTFRRDGVEAVLPRGPLILVANHSNRWDPVALAAALPRPVVFMDWGRGSGRRALGHTLSPRDRSSLAEGHILDRTLDILNRDMALGILLGASGGAKAFSQVRDAVPPRGAATAALLGLRSRASFLPVGITGAEGGWPFRRPRVSVRIGQPFSLPSLEGPLSHATIRELSKMITWRVAALLPTSPRNAAVGDEGQHPTATGARPA